jgi:hypothetical protein
MTKHQLLQSELRPGETLLWTEEPDALAFVTGERVFIVLLGVAWLSMMGFMTEGFSAGSWPFLLFGALFLVNALWETSKAFFTVYGLTESRLLIVRAYPWSQDVESYIDRDIRFLRKARRKLGGNDVVFTTISSEGSKGRVHHRDIGFFGIDDADLVEALIEKNFRYREFNTPSVCPDSASQQL